MIKVYIKAIFNYQENQKIVKFYNNNFKKANYIILKYQITPQIKITNLKINNKIHYKKININSF